MLDSDSCIRIELNEIFQVRASFHGTSSSIAIETPFSPAPPPLPPLFMTHERRSWAPDIFEVMKDVEMRIRETEFADFCENNIVCSILFDDAYYNRSLPTIRILPGKAYCL